MKINETKQKIIDSTFAAVATAGLENVTIKKIANAAKIGESLLYHYFSGKQQLLEECFYHINTEIDKALSMVFLTNDKENFKNLLTLLWQSYLNYFLSHPYKTIFYDQFRHSLYLSAELWKKQEKAFVFFLSFIRENYFSLNNSVKESNLEVFWTIVIETTLCLACRQIKTGRELKNESKEDAIAILLKLLL